MRLTKSNKEIDELAHQAKTNKAALESLMVAVEPIIRAKLKKYYVDGMDKDDLVQDALLNVIKLVDTWDKDIGPFLGLLTKATLNRAGTSVRQSYLLKRSAMTTATSFEQPLDYENDYKLGDTIGKVDADEQTETREAMLRKMFQTLSPVERGAMMLSILGYSLDEIAEKLNGAKVFSSRKKADFKSVDNALQRARNKLRNQF